MFKSVTKFTVGLMCAGMISLTMASESSQKGFDEVSVSLAVGTEYAMPNGSKMVFSTLSAQDREEAIECLSRAFIKENPVTHRQGITKEEFDNYSIPLVDQAIKNGLSLVAREKGSNKLIGCTIFLDLLDEEKVVFSNLSPKFDPILDILNKRKIYNEQNIKYGEYMHWWVAAINEEFMSKGVFYSVAQEYHRIARAKGYKYSIGEATSPRLLSVLVKHFGYSIQGFVNYDSYEYQGSYPFKGLGGAGGACFIIKDLNSPLAKL